MLKQVPVCIQLNSSDRRLIIILHVFDDGGHYHEIERKVKGSHNVLGWRNRCYHIYSSEESLSAKIILEQ